jgi:hypothetical protein
VCIVGVKESLKVMPFALIGVRMGAGLHVKEADAMIYGEMRVTLRFETLVRSPTITDDCSAGFNPCICYSHQSFSGSIQNGNEKRSTRFSLNTAKHPLPLNGVSPIIFALTKLALIDLNNLVKTADLLIAALQVYEHGFFAELAPVRYRSSTEMMLFLDMVDRNAAHDVVCEENNLLESKVTMLKT